MRGLVVRAGSASQVLFDGFTLEQKQRAALRLGQVSALLVLNAQQASLQASLAVVQAKAVRHADTVALFQALGVPSSGRPCCETTVTTSG